MELDHPVNSVHSCLYAQFTPVFIHGYITIILRYIRVHTIPLFTTRIPFWITTNLIILKLISDVHFRRTYLDHNHHLDG
jgi:hypothetical protein